MRKRNFFCDVMASTRVDFTDLRKVIRGEPPRCSNQSRPQPPMDKRDLAPNQATHEDIATFANSSRHFEDLVTLRMSPPATPQWLSSDRFGKRRHRALCPFEDDPVLSNESESLT
jgi:hypothetical protein